jgi:hypothetical protein
MALLIWLDPYSRARRCVFDLSVCCFCRLLLGCRQKFLEHLLLTVMRTALLLVCTVSDCNVMPNSLSAATSRSYEVATLLGGDCARQLCQCWFCSHGIALISLCTSCWYFCFILLPSLCDCIGVLHLLNTHSPPCAPLPQCISPSWPSFEPTW